MIKKYTTKVIHFITKYEIRKSKILNEFAISIIILVEQVQLLIQYLKKCLDNHLHTTIDEIISYVHSFVDFLLSKIFNVNFTSSLFITIVPLSNGHNEKT